MGEILESHYFDYQFEDLNSIEKVFKEIEFEKCLFKNCNFQGAKFLKCRFEGCKFENSNLSLAKIDDSIFLENKFYKSKLTGINWTKINSRLGYSFKFEFCIMNMCTFFGMNLKNTKFLNCEAIECDFVECDLTKADFSETNLTKSSFSRTNLTKANLSKAINYNIDVLNNNLTKTKFSMPEAINLLNCLDIEMVEIEN